jgi:uncharacterized membrane protein YfhO
MFYYFAINSIIKPAVIFEYLIHHFYWFYNKTILCDDFFDCYLFFWKIAVCWDIIVDLESFYPFTKGQNLIIER